MRIFGLTLVKNEADIIRQSMTTALDWCDWIGVIDNGSTDGTYDILTDLARKYPDRFVLCGKRDIPFCNSLRRIPFKALRTEAEEGDWWCRLDADEFYPVSPRSFLQEEVKPHEYVVWSIHLQYYYTDKDYERWKSGEETVEDRKQPIQERRRYYQAVYSEQRFVRHRDGLKWDKGKPWPYHLGPFAKERIPVQHFRYRDPKQMKMRFSTRRQAYEEGHHRWGDKEEENWKKEIREAEKYHLDNHDGEYIIPDDFDEQWPHMESWPRRIVKRFCHGTGIWP